MSAPPSKRPTPPGSAAPRRPTGSRPWNASRTLSTTALLRSSWKVARTFSRMKKASSRIFRLSSATMWLLLCRFLGCGAAPAITASLEQRVDVVLADGVVGQLRPVQEMLVRAGGRTARRRGPLLRRPGRAIALDIVTEGVQQGIHLGLDLLQRGHHLGDALTGDVLEAAGLEDRGDRRGDLRPHLGVHLLGECLDALDRLEAGVGRLLGRADDCRQLVSRRRQVLRIDVVRPQDRKSTRLNPS